MYELVIVKIRVRAGILQRHMDHPGGRDELGLEYFDEFIGITPVVESTFAINR
jgi:hypothetical protein